MQSRVSQTYLESKVLTATPEQLQLMLYEGAIRFALIARQGLVDRDLDRANHGFERLDRILCALLDGLRHEVSPDLCERMSGLYAFCYRRSNEANLRHDIAPLDDCVAILRQIRGNWSALVEQLASQRAQDSVLVGMATSAVI